jgi:ParB family transcriptional regulator, chromosome partitioning protein
MEYEQRSVPLGYIDDADLSFRISFERPVHVIEASIRLVGLIHEPILLPFRDSYRIVSGFARIDACRRLGWTHVPARCLPSDASFLQCALLAVADNAGQRELNIVEQARSFGLIQADADTRDERIGILQKLGISLNAHWNHVLGQVFRMSGRLQSALVEGSIALPVALRLHGMEDGEAEELAVLFQELRISLNRQRELLDWVQQIAAREDTTICDVIHKSPIAQWREEKMQDRGHISQLMREFLRRRRYPEITASEHRFGACLKNLNLPETLHLTAPAHFEGKTFQLRLEFENNHELRELNQHLHKLCESPALIEILSLPVK